MEWQLSAVRTALVDASKRYSRVAHEAEDLAHDIIALRLRRGRSLDDEGFVHSANGTVRRHAAFLARSGARRRAREARSADEGVVECVADFDEREDEGAPLSSLSTTLQLSLYEDGALPR